MNDEEQRRDDFGTARVAASFALVLAVVFMLVVDVFRPDYEANAIIVTSVLGASAALLGVEIVDFIRRSGK
jgi:hypothetical protein